MKTNMKKQTKTKQRRTSVTTNSIVDDACDDEKTATTHDSIQEQRPIYIEARREKQRETI